MDPEKDWLERRNLEPGAIKNIRTPAALDLIACNTFPITIQPNDHPSAR
jgi:hypothetical protein